MNTRTVSYHHEIKIKNGAKNLGDGGGGSSRGRAFAPEPPGACCTVYSIAPVVLPTMYGGFFFFTTGEELSVSAGPLSLFDTRVPLPLNRTVHLYVEGTHGGYVPRVAVVGCGVCGLELGKLLAARGMLATVFDTGEHACGGRASSRDVITEKGQQHSFDHSTQYFTASKGSRFEAMTKDWVKEGLITQWPQGRVGTLASPPLSSSSVRRPPAISFVRALHR